MRKSITVFSLVLMAALTAAAQKNEIGLVVGGKVTPDGSSPFGATTVNVASAFEVNYASQLIGGKAAGVDLNIPLLAFPTSEINRSTVFTAKSYSSLYLTPGLRVHVGTTLSPFVEAGVGLVRFGPSSTTLSGGRSGATNSTKPAYTVGGGVDLRPSKSPVGFRLEVRQLYAGVPNLAVPRLSLHNNVLVGGGIVLRF